jgi:hypothetical protein
MKRQSVAYPCGGNYPGTNRSEILQQERTLKTLCQVKESIAKGHKLYSKFTETKLAVSPGQGEMGRDC